MNVSTATKVRRFSLTLTLVLVVSILLQGLPLNQAFAQTGQAVFRVSDETPGYKLLEMYDLAGRAAGI